MSYKFILSGFSDEACEDFEEQLEFVSKLGVKFIEVRGVSGKNIAELNEDELENCKKLLDKYGVKISSIGSPIGKIQITDDFEPHIETFKNVMSAAKILGTDNIRMFSFYIPQGENPEDYREEVLTRLSVLIEMSKDNNLVLLHENEKGIYGDNAPRCLDLMRELYCQQFKAVFDFANFVQVQQETFSAYKLLKPYISYVHIKDAVGEIVVPPGFGEGNVKEILADLAKNDYQGFLSLEPHLADFAGFSALENEETAMIKSSDGKFSWRIALNSLKAILYDLEGY